MTLKRSPAWGQLPVQDVLPFPPKLSGSIAGRTLEESVYAPLPAPRRLPEDAPNILIVLIDDAGPALPTPLGGTVETRSIEIHTTYAGPRPGGPLDVT